MNDDRDGRRRRPRAETLLLIVAFVVTITVKWLARVPTRGFLVGVLPSRMFEPEHAMAEMSFGVLADLAFFAAVAMLFALVRLTGWRRAAARVNLVIAALVAAWAGMNAVWLLATSVQLQPGILTSTIARSPVESWGIVVDAVTRAPTRLVPAILAAAAVAGWIAWRLVHPRPVEARPRRHVMHAAGAGAVCVAALLGLLLPRPATTSIWGQAVGFNSHWYALRTLLRGDEEIPSSAPRRSVPRAGSRDVVLPPEDTPRPNVVVIFLESVSYPATPLSGRDDAAPMPRLEALAASGTEFVSTHVIVPHTTKALWSGLTGVRPDTMHDAAEAVLVDDAYESLATLLARRGYRSAFFEMSKGAWEGAPALFANLGFDRAWFRENLNDPSANLGWANGDDFRMIDPMFEWVDESAEPFLLTMITSITHDPYRLPKWYDVEPAPDSRGRYLQTIELTDRFVGSIVDELDERGLLDDTVLCILGDHGEVFRPESKRGRWVTYEEAIRIPWIVRWPGHVEAGRRVEWPCAQLDVTPTLLSLLGYGIADAGFEGRNALEPIPADRRLYFSSWLPNSPLGYSVGQRKYVYMPYTDTLFLYDLAADPAEQSPRLVEDPDRAPIIADIRAWERSGRLEFPAQRFRERRLFDHWQVYSAGRTTRVMYLPHGGDPG